MNQKTKQSVAASMETEPKLLPLLPYLIQDLWVMGSSVDQIIKGIKSLKLPAENSVLDLCCGKGGVAVQIAKKFGYNVTGVDAMSVFLKVAAKKAEEFKVSDKCRFVHQDVHVYTGKPHQFDLVILAAAGPVFGSLEHTVHIVRSQVRKSGFIFIDDGYLKQNTDLKDRRGYEYCLNYPDTKKALLSHGDKLVAEINTDEENKAINYKYQKMIEKRGAELIRAYPELEASIRNYIEGQAEECEILDTEIAGMLWILQKGLG